MRKWIRKGMLFFLLMMLVLAGCGAPEEAKEPSGEDVKKSPERIGKALYIAYAEHPDRIEVLSDRQTRVRRMKRCL